MSMFEYVERTFNRDRIVSLFKLGKTMSEIKKEIGCSSGTIARALREKSLFYKKAGETREITENEIVEAVEMYENGLSIYACSKFLKCQTKRAKRVIFSRTEERKERVKKIVTVVKQERKKYNYTGQTHIAQKRVPYVLGPRINLSEAPSHNCLGDDRTKCTFLLDFYDKRGLPACCEADCMEGSSFCEEHHRLCYYKPEKPKNLCQL